MNKGLTKREKVLIFIAASILIIFVSFKFVFTPIYTGYTDITEENVLLETNKTLMEMKLANEALTKLNFERATKKHTESEKYFPSIMTNEELDRLITGLCLKHSIEPTLLGMSIIKKEEAAVSGATSSEETSSEETSSEATESASSSEPISVFTIATAAINASGSYEDLQKMIDEVNATTHIRINSLKYVYTKATAENEKKPPEISIVFEVTMIDSNKLKSDTVGTK